MAIHGKKRAYNHIDMAQARLMQDMILPKQSKLDELEKKFGVRVISHSEPCDITGGDFWGMEEICCNHIAFYIVDCSGHGFSAALNTFRLHALIEDIDDVYIKLMPANFMSLLNRKMCKLMQPGQFATMLYGVINVDSHVMTFATAGATRPIFISKRGKVKMLEGQGFPLGASKNADFPIQRIKFNKGDRLVLYSDALTEAMNAKGRMFGEEKLMGIFNKNPKSECRQLIKEIMGRQKRYRHGGLQDDLTVNIYCRF